MTSRVALHSILVGGREEAYEREHAAVPDEVLVSLRDAGVRDYTIWRSGKHAFHVVDVDDFVAALAKLEGDPANDRWQHRMAAFVDHFEVDDHGKMPLTRVWSMSEQGRHGRSD